MTNRHTAAHVGGGTLDVSQTSEGTTVGDAIDKPPAPKPVAEIMRELGEPFPPAAVKWRLDGKSKDGKARCVAYVDVRTVAHRLNTVLGGDGWKTRMTFLPSGAVLCRLAVRFPTRPNEWITREDVGAESAQPDDHDRAKAACSDALKRVAVSFGVGAYLYRLKSEWLAVDARDRIITLPELPTWAIPEAYRPAGRYAVNLSKLIAEYSRTTGKDQGVYTESVIGRLGVKVPAGTPLANIERRHVVTMMQFVADDIEQHAKYGHATPHAIPKDTPKTGGELLTRLNAADVKGSNAGTWKPGELVAHILSEGIKRGHSTSVDEWNMTEIIRAVEWATAFINAREPATTKKSPNPQQANPPAVSA